MPDSFAPNGVRPAGLPILSTEPLTEAERQILQQTVDCHRKVATAIESALKVGRVAPCLLAMHEAVALAECDHRTVLLLGSNR